MKIFQKIRKLNKYFIFIYLIKLQSKKQKTTGATSGLKSKKVVYFR